MPGWKTWRYAFRYVQITVLDASAKYKVVVRDAVCKSVSSASLSDVPPLNVSDPELQRLNQASLKTMQDCMQLAFEGGPKRDRRRWISGQRLQALANYIISRNNDLVKRCLYLFAGLTQNEERVGACLFLEPVPQVDDTALFDCSLFFVSCLHDCLEAAGDFLLRGGRAEDLGKSDSIFKELPLLVAGAVLIAVGANLLADNGTLIAQATGVPESVIALTFAALGTSLPELVTAITPLERGDFPVSRVSCCCVSMRHFQWKAAGLDPNRAYDQWHRYLLRAYAAIRLAQRHRL